MSICKPLTALALALFTASGAAAQQAQPDAPALMPRAMPARPHMPIPVAALLPDTQAVLDGYVRSGKLPGIVGAFARGEGPTLFVTAGRVSTDAGAVPVGPDTLWRVYSMTKPVTALAAMLLIQDGKLKLDDPLSKYLPAFAHMRVLTSPDTSLASRPAMRPITIRNLLTHTAGFSYNIVAKGPLLHEYERLGILPGAINGPTEVKMRAVRPKTLAEFADRVATLPLIAEPGTKWSYSIALDVMGRVIEVASGMPFDRFVQTRILDPLKMRSSYWQVPVSEAGRLASLYTVLGDRLVLTDPGATSVFLEKPSFPYGGAGLVMSARDYDRFLHMIQDDGTLDGVTVAKPETIALMTSNLLPAGVFFTAPDGARLGFGAGGFVTVADRPGIPKGVYGWAGAANSQAWVDRAGRRRGTIMANIFPSDVYPLRADIVAALTRDAARFK